MVNLFSNEYASVYFDKELDSLYLKYFKKVPSHNDFLIVNEAVLEGFRTQSTHKFIADVRNMGIISLESQQWVVEVLIPKMVAHLNGKTLLHAQLLDPSEVMSKVSASNIKNKSEKKMEGFQLYQFTKEEKLRDFIKEN
ncbi:MAG: hypothetical protein AAF363_20055 [Bacteroidota bacterium]